MPCSYLYSYVTKACLGLFEPWTPRLEFRSPFLSLRMKNNLLERKYEFIFTCEWNFNDLTCLMNNYEWFSIRIDIAHKEFSQVGFYSAKKELRWYPWLALKFLSLENALRSKIMAWVPSMLLSYFLAL